MNYGTLINEQVRTEGESFSNTIIDTIKSNDFGLVGKVKVSFNNIFGFVRYNHGLSNIFDLMVTDENGDPVEDVKQFNRNFQIGLGYKFGFRPEN